MSFSVLYMSFPVVILGLIPGDMLANLFQVVPELCSFANLDLQVALEIFSNRPNQPCWCVKGNSPDACDADRDSG
jgi:hypothetical protein